MYDADDTVDLLSDDRRFSEHGPLLPAEDSLRNEEMEVVERTFAATDEMLHKAIAFVEENLELHEAAMKAIMAITVSLEEMFVNVAHYAYPDSEGDVKIVIGFEGDNVEITLIDEGIPFDPLAKEEENVGIDITEPLYMQRLGEINVIGEPFLNVNCEHIQII